jgi:hypothetical protein
MGRTAIAVLLNAVLPICIGTIFLASGDVDNGWMVMVLRGKMFGPFTFT